MSLFNRKYCYKNPQGRMELTNYKMAPSELRRANVPPEMVQAYSRVFHGERNILIPDIESFLEKQESFQFGHVDLEAIEKLLKSDASIAEIAHATNMTRTKVSKLKECPPKVVDLSVLETIDLTEYAEKYELDQKQEDINTDEIETPDFNLANLISNHKIRVERSGRYRYGKAGISLIAPAIGLLFDKLYANSGIKSKAYELLEDYMETYVAKTGSVYFSIDEYTVRISNHPSSLIDSDFKNVNSEKDSARIYLSKNF